MNLSRDRIGGLILLIFFTGYGLLSRNIELLPVQQQAVLTARTIPITLTILGLCGALWLIALPPDRKPFAPGALHWPRFAGFVLMMSLYGWLLRPLGFVAATVLFLGGGFWLLGERRWWRLVAVAAAVSIGFWALMSYPLGVYLPPLPEPAWLGGNR